VKPAQILVFRRLNDKLSRTATELAAKPPRYPVSALRGLLNGWINYNCAQGDDKCC
jgi:hypothetical protein